jgi:hypothetical protein
VKGNSRHWKWSGGGGLLVYSKELQILPINNYNYFNQHCSFKVKKEQNQLNVMLVYRPPGIKRDSDDKLRVNPCCREKFTIRRRFQYAGVDWEEWRAEARWREVIETVREKDMEQFIKFPTHKG